MKKLIKTTLGYVLFFLIFDLAISFGLRGIIDLVAGHGYQTATYVKRSILDMPNTFIFFFFWGWVEYSYRKHQAKKRARASKANPK
ncbi:hypothetical protein [Oenococcus sp.]|uniref:hypothetical protein n=1 Tax=Oenococcus sp. TaxID=1979414 RepID=UPI0039EA6877